MRCTLRILCAHLWLCSNRPLLAAEGTLKRQAPADPPSKEAAARSGAPNYESTVTARPLLSAASASSILNSDFEWRPKTSPNDTLRVVPGLLAVQHQGGGKADQLFLRGFDADHGTDVGIFIDGVPVNLPSLTHTDRATPTSIGSFQRRSSASMSPKVLTMSATVISPPPVPSTS
jgi:outer membrane receptor for Fe3+-dicitrate